MSQCDTGVSQCDTGVSQQNNPIEGKPSFEAFKSFRTDFFRYRANLKNRNGDDNTIAAKINQALRGMLYHFDTVNPDGHYKLQRELVEFIGIHHSVLKERYEGLNGRQTPLWVYAESFKQLYEKVAPKGAEV